MKKPLPLAVMLLLAILWTGGFIGLVIASRAFPALADLVKSGKTLHALGIWVWVYIMTSSVAQLKGRRGWPWYLFGLLAMWGS